MEAAGSSVTLVNINQNIRCHIPNYNIAKRVETHIRYTALSKLSSEAGDLSKQPSGLLQDKTSFNFTHRYVHRMLTGMSSGSTCDYIQAHQQKMTSERLYILLLIHNHFTHTHTRATNTPYQLITINDIVSYSDIWPATSLTTQNKPHQLIWQCSCAPQTAQRERVGLLTNNKLERVCKEATMSNRDTIPALDCRNWGKPWISSVRIACVLAEIRTEHLPTGSLQSYR
jgi:hypothetical protein